MRNDVLCKPIGRETDVSIDSGPSCDAADCVLTGAEHVDGRFAQYEVLPNVEDCPVPEVLLRLPVLHENRPRGSGAILDANRARARLRRGHRAGAWMVSPMTGCKFAVLQFGIVAWVPTDTELPSELQVGKH